MLDLQPGVDLEEGRLLAIGVVDELDGSRPSGTGPSGPTAAPTRPWSGATASGRARGRRLLDHLLVAALERAVALAERHHPPVAVTEDLHLDVAGPLDQSLEEHTAGRGSSAPATRDTDSKAPATSSGEPHGWIPMPPPPPVAFTMTGYRARRRHRRASATSPTRPVPGSSGTPAAVAA